MSKKLIYTSYSPNTRVEDIKLNWKLLLNPFYSGWKDSEKIYDWFNTRFNSSNVNLYNYARSAMFDFFSAVGIQEDDEVIYQAFTCIAAINPAVWAGATPVFVDIQENSLAPSYDDIVNKVTDKTKVIVLQYTMGFSPEIKRIVEFAKEKGIYILEDCTQELGTKIDGEFTGSFGDAAVFSFGRDKIISGVNGGVLVVNNPNLIVDRPVNRPSWFWTFRELLYPILWCIVKRTYTSWKIGKGFHFLFTKLGLLSRATTLDEKKGIRPKDIPAMLPDKMATLAFNQLKDLDEMNNHRRKIAEIYANELKNIPEIKTLHFNENQVPLRFNILVEDHEDLMKYMESKNILLGDWYRGAVAPKEAVPESVGYVAGSCPNAENIGKSIVNLPTHVNISERKARLIVNEIKNYYGKK